MKTINISRLLGKYSLLLTSTFFSSTALSEVTLDGSMGTAGALAGPDYQITENLGQRAGNNLFHSFGQFNLNSAESATFSGSTGIQNVISRVTGGQASTIDGAIRSTMPNANIYFLNPSGVIFGENASLDVQGSFHASTANYLKFKDGVKFDTGLATANPILTTASPEAFGFLDNTPAPISVSGGLNKVLKVPEGATLSLVAGDMSINDRSLYAPGGQVILASTGSTGEVVFNESGIDTSSFSKGGNIQLSRLAANPVITINDTTQIADIDVSADEAGKVVIRGGQMVMDNAYIWANTTNKDGGDIDINLADDLTINGVAEIPGIEKTPQSGITAYTQGKGNAGNILLNVDDLKLTHGTRIDSTAISQSSGNGGNLLINTNSILLEGNDPNAVPRLITGTNSSGNAGNIIINNIDKLQVNKGAFIRTFTTAKGDTGAISVNTGSLDLHDGSQINSKVTKTAEGNSADLTINASHAINMHNNAIMSNSSDGEGNAGNLNIKSDSIALSGDSIIQNITNGQGNSGQLAIVTSALKVKNGSILNHTKGIGNAGNLTINTGSLELINGKIGSEPNATATVGQNGSIDINANTIILKGDSFETRAEISNNYFGNKKTGNLTVVADKLEIYDWAGISMDNSGTGNTGDLFVKANEIVMLNTAGGMNGISANLNSTGNSGDLTIESQNLTIRDGGQIEIINQGKGNSGVLSLKIKEDIIMDGFSTFTNKNGGSAAISSSISNVALSSGQVKNVFISAKNILVKNNARINTTTVASSNGANLIIKADHFDVQELSQINSGSVSVSDTTLTTGNGGNINITVNHLGMKGSFITTLSDGMGNAGDITIHANNIELMNDNGLSTPTGISTSTRGAGKAGNLTINTTNNLLLNDSFLASSSSFIDFNSTTEPETAKSGNINITANGAIQLENNSAISSQTDKANAGAIKIDGEAILQLHDDSRIQSKVSDGQGQGGDIFIDNPIVALDDKSFISANAVRGAGGNITISSFLFQSPSSFVTASSELNVDGQLNLKPETNMSGNLTVLPESLLNASEHLSDRCVSRSEGKKNSFVVKSLGSIPLSPGELSPTNFLDFLPTEKNRLSPNVKNTEISLKNDNQLSFNNIPCTQ